jgi:hypothetical protein
MARILVRAGIAVVVALAALWGIGNFWGAGGGGDAGGTGAEQPATEAEPQPAEPATQPDEAPPPEPVRPLVVEIDAHSYFLDGVEAQLEEVVRRATQVPAGAGFTVVVMRRSGAEYLAERKLRDALTGAGIAASDIDWRDSP